MVKWGELREFLNSKIKDNEPIDTIQLPWPIRLQDIECETGPQGVTVWDVTDR